MLAHPNMRKLSWVLLLPLFLLFAQQGELLHEYSHDGRPLSSSQKKAPVQPEHCPLCLAYAHLAGAATPELVAPTLLSDLDFHFAPVVAVVSVDTPAAQPRSRGPPSL
jgi:hypothetical protein